MSRGLSPQVEQYLASIVAGGLFPSEQAALEAAVAALREKIEPIAPVPDEHVELIEQGVASLRAGRGRAFTDADWDELRQLARDAARGNQPGSH